MQPAEPGSDPGRWAPIHVPAGASCASGISSPLDRGVEGPTVFASFSSDCRRSRLVWKISRNVLFCISVGIRPDFLPVRPRALCGWPGLIHHLLRPGEKLFHLHEQRGKFVDQFTGQHHIGIVADSRLQRRSRGNRDLCTGTAMAGMGTLREDFSNRGRSTGSSDSASPDRMTEFLGTFASGRTL